MILCPCNMGPKNRKWTHNLGFRIGTSRSTSQPSAVSAAVGERIGRFVKACAAYRFAVTRARSRTSAMTNFACSSRSLTLRALIAGIQSCVLVNVFMDLPPVSLVASQPRLKFSPWITAV
jgi:hypothetical protein